jgi:general secretion pathway protein N
MMGLPRIPYLWVAAALGLVATAVLVAIAGLGGEESAEAITARGGTSVPPPLAQVSVAPVDVIGSQALSGEGNPLWAIPLSSLTSTRERPLFSASRRPPARFQPVLIKSEPELEPKQSMRPPLILVGAIAADRDSIAIFVEVATKAIIRLRTGESYSGWVLRMVAQREVTLQKGQQISVLTLPSVAVK